MKRRQVLVLAAGALPGLQLLAANRAPHFEVPDSRTRKRTLSEFKGKTVVLEWTAASCPFVRAQYASGVIPELQRAAAAQGIVWLSVLSTHPSRRDYLSPDKAEAMHAGRGAAPAALLMASSSRRAAISPTRARFPTTRR